jgi:predicted nucleotidyltransferase
MIRENRRLPNCILDNIPDIVKRISEDDFVIALFIFGSGAKGMLKPLSDLDFGILLSMELGKKERFEKQLELIGTFNETFKTDEVDLVLMNDAPIRFSYNILRDGRLLFCRDRNKLVAFVERTMKLYLDFKFFRDDFDRAYLKGVGYHG